MTDSPPFTLRGLTFTCTWVVEDGAPHNAGHYEWQANGLSVGRNEGAATCWARVEDRIIGRGYRSLKEAMSAAINQQRAAA